MSTNKHQTVKNFYSNDRLNKGYQEVLEKSETSEKPQGYSRDLLTKRYESLLPPMEVISEYENISPGILEKIVKMAQLEQEHRFALEKVALSSNERTRKLATIFGAMTVSIISASTIMIAQSDSKTALIFASIAFTAIFGISLLSFLRRRGNYDRSKHHHMHKNEKRHEENRNHQPHQSAQPSQNLHSHQPHRQKNNKRRKVF